jgi:hypothetical protein
VSPHTHSHSLSYCIDPIKNRRVLLTSTPRIYSHNTPIDSLWIPRLATDRLCWLALQRGNLSRRCVTKRFRKRSITLQNARIISRNLRCMIWADDMICLSYMIWYVWYEPMDTQPSNNLPSVGGDKYIRNVYVILRSRRRRWIAKHRSLSLWLSYAPVTHQARHDRRVWRV